MAELEARHAAGALTAAEEAEYVALLAKVKGIHNTESPSNGSGPQHGIIEISDRVKSVKAFQNFKPNTPADFVYDPTTNRLVVATSRTARNGHTGLVRSLGAAERTVVGGRLRRGPSGGFETSEWSGHYGDQWTPAIRAQYKDFMLRQTGKPVNHSNTMRFSDGTN